MCDSVKPKSTIAYRGSYFSEAHIRRARVREELTLFSDHPLSEPTPKVSGRIPYKIAEVSSASRSAFE